MNTEYVVTRVLTKETALELKNKFLESGTWHDGLKSTNGINKETKNNLEVMDCVNEKHLIQQYYNKNNKVHNFAYPNTIGLPIISKTLVGGYYNLHFDSPHNGNVSTTLFLSEPGEYQGGELELYLDGGVKSFKLEAGKAILYNTQIPHRVKKVTKGQRIASVTWLRSMIPDKNIRKQLWRLHCLEQSLTSRYKDFDKEKDGWNAETLRESTDNPQFQLKAIIAEIVAQNLIIPEPKD
jgi:PKHD-type hydroxylase